MHGMAYGIPWHMPAYGNVRVSLHVSEQQTMRSHCTNVMLQQHSMNFGSRTCNFIQSSLGKHNRGVVVTSGYLHR